MSFKHYTNKVILDCDTIVFVDLDNTLIEYEGFKTQVWYNALVSAGFEQSKVEHYYGISKNDQGVYDYLLHLRHLAGSDNVLEVAGNLNRYFSDVKNYLYEDAKEFISKQSECSNVFLLTYGEENFQKLKFINSGLSDLFHGAIYTVVRKPEFFRQTLSKAEDDFIFTLLPGKKFRRVLFIDDYPQEFMLEHNWNNFLQYRVRRNGAKYSDIQTPQGVIEINSLSEIKL